VKEQELREETRSDESSENVRAKDINTSRFSLFREKGDRKRSADGEEGERSLPSVHVGKGVCNAVESSGAKSQMEPTRAAVRRERRVEEECYRIKWLRAHKHGFELATLFDVHPPLSLSLSLSLSLFPSVAIPKISLCDWMVSLFRIGGGKSSGTPGGS